MNERTSESTQKRNYVSFGLVLLSAFVVFIMTLSLTAFFSSQFVESDIPNTIPNISAADLEGPGFDPAVKKPNEVWMKQALAHAQKYISTCYWWVLEQDSSVGSDLVVKVMFSRTEGIIIWEEANVTKSPSLFFRPCLERSMEKNSLIDLPGSIGGTSMSGIVEGRINMEIKGSLKNGDIIFHNQ